MFNKIRHLKYLWIWHFHTVRVFIARLVRKARMCLGDSSSIINAELRDELYNAKKVAVIAIYPINDDFYAKSLKHLLSGMTENQVSICAMVNGEISPEISEILVDFKCTVFLRKNKGRDFGAYQDGINWLIKNELLQNIDRLFFANDTLMWFEDSNEVVSQSMTEDWHSLFFNLQGHAHAQSFFLSFSGNVLKNAKFLEFWKKYSATKYRKAAIVYGEMALSSLLLKNGFTCATLVNPTWIDFKFESLSLSKGLKDLLHVIEVKGNPPAIDVPGTRPTAWSIQEQIEKYTIEETEFTRVDDQSFLFHFKNMLCQNANSHAPHRIGIFLYVLFGLPMKADIYKVFSLSEVSRVIKFRNPEVLRYADDFYMSKSQKYMLGTRKNERQKRRGEL